MEILSHASLFLIFLTLFYVTFVGFIQGKSMISEFDTIASGAIRLMGTFLPPNILRGVSTGITDLKPGIDNAMQGLESTTESENRRIMKPVVIYVLGVSLFSFLTACLIARYIGYSVTELVLENLVALTIIGLTDLVITTVYGTFRLLDSQYIEGIVAVRASGGSSTINCNVVQNTLDSMFPIPFVESIIKFLLDYQPPA